MCGKLNVTIKKDIKHAQKNFDRKRPGFEREKGSERTTKCNWKKGGEQDKEVVLN